MLLLPANEGGDLVKAISYFNTVSTNYSYSSHGNLRVLSASRRWKFTLVSCPVLDIIEQQTDEYSPHRLETQTFPRDPPQNGHSVRTDGIYSSHHLVLISTAERITYSQLFFDDEHRNFEVESLGVTMQLVPGSGTDRKLFKQGLTLWRKRRGITLNEFE